MLSDSKGLSKITDRHLDESLNFSKHKVGKTHRKRKDSVHNSCGSGLEKWWALDILRNLNLFCTLDFPRVNFPYLAVRLYSYQRFMG